MVTSPARDRPRDPDRALRVAGVARDRQRFLAGERLEPTRVRDVVLASWQRSLDQNVAPERVAHEYQDLVDLDTLLGRGARPVLRALGEQLEGQAVSIILTDQSGLVLSRTCLEHELDRYLDVVELAPGFRYGEDTVGTNGIGTALEMGGPVAIVGHEHYVENLEKLSCAAVPIRHPMTGRTVGALNLTCWTRDAGPLLLSLAKTAVASIRREMSAGASSGQLELLEAFARACRRSPGIVFAISGETVILGDSVRSRLSPDDQSAMVNHALESLADGGHRQLDIDLPSGGRARMQAHAVGDSGAGTVVSVSLGERWADRRRALEHRGAATLPGIVGTAPVWVHCCREVEAAAGLGEWLVVRGEPGVGKRALLTAAHARHHPGSQAAVLDAAAPGTRAEWAVAVSRAFDGEASGVVVAGVGGLRGEHLTILVEVLRQVRRRRGSLMPWAALTTEDGVDEVALAPLLELFPRTVDVPPLRLHPGDLGLLVPHLLRRLDAHSQLTCSPEVMATMARSSWPGNVTELHGVLREIAAHRRGGQITVDELPSRVRTVSRRRLTHIETLERDAVVQALVHSHGDKTRAAKALGMSRATIYRKIRGYGIVLPPRQPDSN